MATLGKPKALLFDIGGVCVVSPFQAILDYELANSIPPGYINFAISRTAPNGSWHRLERGEVPMDDAWFEGFSNDLHRLDLWRTYCARVAVSRSNSNSTSSPFSTPSSPSESSSSTPETPPLPTIDAKYLFWEMMRISRTPDPYMYPALRRLKASGQFLLGALSNTVIFPPGHPYNDATQPGNDVRAIFDVFVSSAHVGLRKPDPKIYHLAMKEMRKALARGKGPGASGGGVAGSAGARSATRTTSVADASLLAEQDVVFFDDIGENVKVARQLGLRTVKVTLGRTRDAVRELERLTGLSLLEDGPERGLL